MTILEVLSSRITRTREEVNTTVLTSHLSFIQNLTKGDKMKLASQLALNMFKVSIIFSLVFARHDC